MLIVTCITNGNVICISVSEAMCDNINFSKPTRSKFQAQMRDALRTAKERYRHKARGDKQPADRNRRNLWADEEGTAEDI